MVFFFFLIKTVDEYIKTFPRDVGSKLKAIRDLVKSGAPGAVEGISYGIAGYKLNAKPLVYFAGYGGHIGFYPTPSAVKYFNKELMGYKTSKGAVQLPLDKPVPTALLKKIIQFRVKEVSVKVLSK